MAVPKIEISYVGEHPTNCYWWKTPKAKSFSS